MVKKINGAGSGFFEYTFEVTDDINLDNITSGRFIVECSAKELYVKDMDQQTKEDFNFMLGERDDPSRNPNAYPMTDEKTFPSEVSITINDKKGPTINLEDDPADHRGVLSWHYQPHDNKIREAGSYGYLIEVGLDQEDLVTLRTDKKLTVRLEVEGEGGLAIYGKSFGQLPIDPSLVLR